MSRKARKLRQRLRNLANPDGYNVRYFKRYEWAGRKVNSDRHMAHLWMDEFYTKAKKSDRKPAPIHNGRKP